MAEIITTLDLPTALQGGELAEMMVDGANAKASRVAPCLTIPIAPAWAASTAYAVGDQVALAAAYQFLEATEAGTSGVTAPVAPPLAVGETVTDGTVTWARVAPTVEQLNEARLILIGAVKRWVDAGSGAISQQSAGPYAISVDTRQRSSGFNFWPSEIAELQGICSAGTNSSGGAFSITPSSSCSVHLPWCALNFGATYCSCGADLTGYCYPLFEGGALSGDEY